MHPSPQISPTKNEIILVDDHPSLGDSALALSDDLAQLDTDAWRMTRR